MADPEDGSEASEDWTGSGEEQFWRDVFPGELAAINERIKALNELRPGCSKPPIEREAGSATQVVGLALSGGGVRSAAISLGALQALNQHGVIDNIHYLSTVSGGGYAGGSMIASMSKTGEFAFGNAPRQGVPVAAVISDTAAVGHVRNYSNFLIPFGLRDVLTSVVIVLRGIMANFVSVQPALLLAAAVTIWTNPTVPQLATPDLLGQTLTWIPFHNFGLSIVLALAGFVLFFLWALFRSLLPQDERSEFRISQRSVSTRQKIAGRLPRIASFYLVALAIFFFAESQPFVIFEMFRMKGAADNVQSGGVFTAVVAAWVTHPIDQIWGLASLTVPIAAIVVFFREQIGGLLADTESNATITSMLLRFLAGAATWLGAAALPLVLWVVYLYLSFWGILNTPPTTPPQVACAPLQFSGTLALRVQGQSIASNLSGDLTFAGAAPCNPADTAQAKIEAAESPPYYPGLEHAPGSIQRLARFVDGFGLKVPPLALVYTVIALVLGALAYLLKPNANSLHRLYRDRLSKTFFFDPKAKAIGQAEMTKGRDFMPLDDMKLHEIDTRITPYPLINTTLNVQGSDIANRRGRNGDFFLFSPLFTGSFATRYAPTDDLEKLAPDLDFPTAIAISGAAASSNMGAKSVGPFKSTLAILNLRLGYWLINPHYLASGRLAFTPAARRVWVYLYSQITERLYEDTDLVYLTDGGHIENLGIYELLRRKCALIIVVDGEEDRDMRFASFAALQRYARIDLGIRINVPWNAVSETTRYWMGVGSSRKPKPPEVRRPASGPHVAIGMIEYSGGQTGTLVYVKASLSGDENDYLRDYARRYPAFPHELTRVFSEEQIEVYRELGFHAMFGFLSKEATVAVALSILEPATQAPPLFAPAHLSATPRCEADPTLVRADHPALAAIHRMLGT